MFQALSASSIALVLTVCERVDPQELFSSQPFPLKQNVLLSLIQQLSIDLNDHTELKRRYILALIFKCTYHKFLSKCQMFKLTHSFIVFIFRYLEEAVMGLDANDADVRKHMYIISKLQEQLMAYVHAHPGSGLSRQMKMLYMATSNLVHPPTSP